MKCLLAVATLLVASVEIVSRCWAQGAPVELEWNAPDGCPDRAEIARRVEALLGHPATSNEALAFRAEVRETDDGHFRATLRSRWAGGSTERTFEAVDCAKIGRAAALIVAMAIDPVDVAEVASEPRPQPQPQPRAPEEPRATPVEAPAVHLGFGMRATVDVGSLPLPTIGGGPLATLRFGAWELQLGAQAWIPRRTAGSTPTGAGGEIGLLTGEARACREIVPLALTLSLCLGGEAGVTDGAAFGIPVPRHPRSLWLAALGGAIIRPRVASGLWAWMSFDAAVPLTPPDYAIEGLGSVHRPWPVVGRASMGVEIQGL
jgi:hypothetical protein